MTITVVAHRARHASRTAVSGSVALAAALTLAAPARAQLPSPGGIGGLIGGLIGGSPQIVYDPSAVAKLVAQIRSQLRQIDMQRQQLAEQVASMRKLPDPSWRRIDGVMGDMAVLLAEGRSLAYTLRSVDAEFRRTFPGNRTFGDYPSEATDQAARTLATFRGALNAVGRAARDVPTSVDRLSRMKRQLGAVRGHEQALELNGTIGIYGAEELTMLRQAVALLTNVEAVYDADQVNMRSQREATVRTRLAALSSPGRRFAPLTLTVTP